MVGVVGFVIAAIAEYMSESKDIRGFLTHLIASSIIAIILIFIANLVGAIIGVSPGTTEIIEALKANFLGALIGIIGVKMLRYVSEVIK